MMMNSINKTMYIPLFGKSYVSKKGIILQDKMAEEIWAKEGFELKGKSATKWLAYYMGMRARVFDDWVSKKMSESNGVVLHLGCGLDSRAVRVAHKNHHWYDVDFESVITERRRYFQESGEYRMLAADVSREGWLEQIGGGDTAVVVTVSSRLSGTFQSAVIASEDFEGKVFVVDSRSVAIGAGILVQEGLKLIEQGLSAEEVARRLIAMRDKIQVYALLDTLEYLKKGGRSAVY